MLNLVAAITERIGVLSVDPAYLLGFGKPERPSKQSSKKATSRIEERGKEHPSHAVGAGVEKHRPTFRKNYLNPVIGAWLIEMTDFASPNSPIQKYRLSPG